MFVLEGELANKKKVLELEKEKTSKVEMQLGKDTSHALDKLRSQGEIHMTIENFFGRLHIKHRDSVPSHIDMLQSIKTQLMDIQEFTTSWDQQQQKQQQEQQQQPQQPQV
eukprot:TRINITY_DN2306_c0_g1_i3.p6 TRINITY_DN2306_c0_g1~~TRINITY_DN2306_c0_g1_i3.p6  ORF type:complete len:110 (+),score=57.58 TRINITY_DN2306_c0_g1_i3:1139-1468(+)